MADFCGLNGPRFWAVFVLLWVVALLLSSNYIFHVHARALLHTLQNIPPPQLQLSQPNQSVGCLSVVIENSPKKTPDMPGL
tara:strand:+ start:25 stop:267 length:243 start_codon:yes stop_codon:yes gene_type:complete